MSDILAERIDDMIIVLDNELTLDEAAKLRDDLDGCLMDYDAMKEKYPPVWGILRKPKFVKEINLFDLAHSLIEHETRCINIDVFYTIFGNPPPGAIGTLEFHDMCWKAIKDMGYELERRTCYAQSAYGDRAHV